MLCKNVITALMFLLILQISTTMASVPDDYIAPGRIAMFDGSLASIRSAHQTFTDGINDSGCVDCSTNRELRFLRALSGSVMLFVRDDGGTTNSIFELANKFGIDVLGDYWAPYHYPDNVTYSPNLNKHDTYELPAGAPDANELRDIIDNSLIPELDAIVADLDEISDSPGDRFKIYLDPNELRQFFTFNSQVFNPGAGRYDPNSRFLSSVEVDYGEVLLMKTILAMTRTYFQVHDAYDMNVDPNLFAEKLYGKNFNINTDLLDTHPDFLNLLPDANGPNDSTAVLAQARNDLVDAINNYLNMVAYITSEDSPAGSDPQEDELIYLDPNDKTYSDNTNSRLITLRDSLTNDTTGTYPWHSVKKYDVNDPCSSTRWTLELNLDIIGHPRNKIGTFVASDNNSAPSPWKIVDTYLDGNEVIYEMEYVSAFSGALLTVTLSDDANSLSNGTFTYWGVANGTLSNLTGQIAEIQITNATIDLNPILGSSARYPDPINLRDMLPELSNRNYPIIGTMGAGFGYDPTLAGVTPTMTQLDWQTEFNSQPVDLLYLEEANFWQKSSGWVTLWLTEQLIFSDMINEIEKDNDIENVDIDRLYMAYDDTYLHGAIVLNDYNDTASGEGHYEIHLSYIPHHTKVIGSMKFDISTTGTSSVYAREKGLWGASWEFIGNFESRMGNNSIEFKIPWAVIPNYLPGRYISLNSNWGTASWNQQRYDDNKTHVQIGGFGSISGTVTYDDYDGHAIIIQAYTDIENPYDSVVASTVITEPGPYTLQGLGLGFEGYVRAVTPLFGFDNPFELRTLDIQSSVEVFLWLDDLQDVDMVINNPKVLKNGLWENGDLNATLNNQDWYAFDVIEGAQHDLDLNRLTSTYATITLYARNADKKLDELFFWQTQHINVNSTLPAGRYYVEVDNPSTISPSETYQIRMTSDVDCPTADIASADGIGYSDCKVDFYDASALISQWLNIACGDCSGANLDGIGGVDMFDYAILADEWAESAVP